MAGYSITRDLRCCLAIHLAFYHAIEDEVRPNGDSLGIRLDYELSKKAPILFSSRLELTEDPKISDRQLKILTADAYKEMEIMTKKYKFGNAKKPNVHDHSWRRQRYHLCIVSQERGYDSAEPGDNSARRRMWRGRPQESGEVW